MNENRIPKQITKYKPEGNTQEHRKTAVRIERLQYSVGIGNQWQNKNKMR